MIAIDHFKFENYTDQSYIRKNFSLKKERTENSKIDTNINYNDYETLFVNKFNCNERGVPVFQLFSHFTENILTINISRNYVKYLNSNYLPPNLRKLDISHNQIPQIDNIPSTLEDLKVSENPIQTLPPLPNNLKTLKASKCYLSLIPELPPSLEILSVKNNRLRSLHNSILNCNNLQDLKYENNPQIMVSNEILEFIDQLFLINRMQNTQNNQPLRMNYNNFIITKPKLRNVYKDGQNVHDTTINSSTRNSIKNIIKSVGYTKQPLIKNTIKKFKERVKKIYGKDFCCKKFNKFHMFCKLNYTVSEVDQTFGQIFYYIWKIIEKKEEEIGNEICRIIYNEIDEMYIVCFTGKIGRLVNSLSGFIDEVDIKIDTNQQVQAKYT